jgi:hypothetical protein
MGETTPEYKESAKLISEEDAEAEKARLHTDADRSLKKWWFRDFQSVGAALIFANMHPAQGAGEISATARSDGTVGMFYYF